MADIHNVTASPYHEKGADVCMMYSIVTEKMKLMMKWGRDR